MDFFDISFWQGFVGNLLATIIGVAVGVPVAFWINRRVETSNEQAKKKKILQVLAKELTENRLTIKVWTERRTQEAEMKTIGSLLRDEVWSAFSDGGELQWIKDPYLLSDLASIYGEVNRVKYLSDKYLTLEGLKPRVAVRKDISKELLLALERLAHNINYTLTIMNEHRGIPDMTLGVREDYVEPFLMRLLRFLMVRKTK